MSQVWGTADKGGYLYSDVLSKRLRLAVQPLVRFRQFCDAQLALGHGSGDTFNFNKFSDLAAKGTELTETDAAPIPETSFTIRRGQGTVTEYGNSVPYTKKLDDLSLQPVAEIIEKLLKLDCAHKLDELAHAQFKATPLLVNSTSATGIAIDEDGGSTSTATTQALNTTHVKLVADELAERDIPPYDNGGNYIAIFRPRALRAMKNGLESIHQYVSEGWFVIMNGEKGRYEGIRFIEQTNIAQVGSSTTGIDEGYFIGKDTVIEAVATPEEIRGKIPEHYGLKKGIAWYALLGFKIVHDDVVGSKAPNARIMRWFVSN